MQNLLSEDTQSIPRHLSQGRIACRVDLFYSIGILIYLQDGSKPFRVLRERVDWLQVQLKLKTLLDWRLDTC